MAITEPTVPSSRPITAQIALQAEDHALVSVPAADRRSGWNLSIGIVGVVTALVIFAIAGFTVILAGFWLGLLAGVLVGILGFGLSALLGRMSWATGVSSTITSRFFGFGLKGSSLGAIVFAFMILGFLALESALLYEGTILMLGLEDTLATKLVIYGLLTIAWITLALFGLKLALRASTVLTVLTIAVAIFVVVQIAAGGADLGAVFTQEGIVPGTWWDKVQAAIAVGGATAGTIALVTSDFARFAKTRKDVVILAAAGPVVQNVLMTVLGALVVVGGLPAVVDYLMARDTGLTPEAAAAAAGGFAMGNTGAFFVVIAGWLGFVTIYAAQAKAQAVNAYSGSLALVNLVNALTGRKPSRALMVVVGNVIALVMIAGGILGLFSAWLAYLGCMTLALVGVMIADFYFVRRGAYDKRRIENWNWAGVISLVVSAGVGIWMIAGGVWALGFLVSLAVALVLYPVLRRLLPEGTGTGFASSAAALDEAA
ncbi:purine-cytosine permease family protein [Microbacterium rhizophilus]|uniref:purine-cytosine permease family protein n=1 Tax=Microbacterium rhizophilus TaxID=3138934 RepID=UPI0031EEFE6B